MASAVLRRVMAKSVAADGVRPGMNPRTASIVASYLELLARVVYAQPASLPAMLEGSTAKLHALVDHWLALAAFRHVPLGAGARVRFQQANERSQGRSAQLGNPGLAQAAFCQALAAPLRCLQSAGRSRNTSTAKLHALVDHLPALAACRQGLASPP